MHGETAGEETTHPPSPPARSDGPAAGKTGGVARAPREAERSEREGDDIVSNGREKGEEEKGSGRGATVEKRGGKRVLFNPTLRFGSWPNGRPTH